MTCAGGNVFKCLVGNKRGPLYTPHRHHVKCAPQEGSSLGFLSQWFVISGEALFHSSTFPHSQFRNRWNPRVSPTQRQKIYFSIHTLVWTGSRSAGIYYITLPFSLMVPSILTLKGYSKYSFSQIKHSHIKVSIRVLQRLESSLGTNMNLLILLHWPWRFWWYFIILIFKWKRMLQLFIVSLFSM